MSKNLIITVVVVLVLILAGFFLLKSNKSTNYTVTPTTQPSDTSSSPSAQPSEASSAAAEKNLVKITADGFSPKQITIKNGESITWENDDTQSHTVNSDNHPTHLLYPFLNLGAIKPGEKKSVTPPNTGTFTYHDHFHPSLRGSITVQ